MPSSPRSAVFWLGLCALTTVVRAQTGEEPLFGPPRTDGKASSTARSTTAPRPGEQEDATLKRFERWPEQPAIEASRELMGRGAEALAILDKGLKDGDWRIRAASAFTLGEMKENSAYPRIQQATREIANRIALRTFFDAMIKIDPVAATSDILPFLTLDEGRSAKEAFDALPSLIDERFLPRIEELVRHRDNEVRHRGARLLARLTRSPDPAIWFSLLGDPSAKVARLAAESLALNLDDGVASRLLELLGTGNLRSAPYAGIALVLAEDRSNRVLVPEAPDLVERLRRFAAMNDQLPSGAAACVLANLSMRSPDDGLRELADRNLVPLLLGVAFSGTSSNDFSSVYDLCLRKVAMLTGEPYSEDRDRWVRYWRDKGDAFRSRRELRGVREDEIASMVVELTHRREKDRGDEIRASFHGENAVAVSGSALLEVADLRRIIEALGACSFFATRGDAFDPGFAGDYVEMIVRVGRSEFRRVHYGPEPESLVPLESLLLELAKQELWQSFRDPRLEPDSASWIRRMRPIMARHEGAARDQEVARLALDSWRSLDPRARRGAARIIGTLDPTWLEGHRVALLDLCRTEKVDAAALVPLFDALAALPGPEVLRAVLDLVPFLDPTEDREAIDAFLARRPIGEVCAAGEDETGPDIRAALIRRLGGALPDPTAEALLHRYALDDSMRVKNAFVVAIVGPARKDFLAGLETRIEKAQGDDRSRLIEMMGALGKDEAAPLLRRLGASESHRDREAAMRAWRAADTALAVQELVRLARTENELDLRQSATQCLAAMQEPGVPQAVRAWLTEEKDPDRIAEALPAAARIFRDDLIGGLGSYLSHPNVDLRRRAALILGARGCAEAVPALLELVSDRSWSSKAIELLEQLTCTTVADANPEAVRAHYENFWQAHRTESAVEWFASALRKRGESWIDLSAYMRGEKRDPRGLSLLLKLLGSDDWILRTNAALLLEGARGEGLGEVNRQTPDDELVRIRNRWAEWYRSQQ